MENKSASELWESFKLQNPNAPAECAAWAFGNSKEMADELCELVLEGLKTATSSAFQLYELEQDELPKAGEYSIILNGDNEAVGIVQNRKVTVYPFNEVPEQIAFEEGEGDRTLAYWREVHETYFKRSLAENKLTFNEEMLVVCEQFELVYAA